KTISYYDQQNELPRLKEEMPEYQVLGSHALQETVRRVDRAFQAFYRRVRRGEKPGFPRYKRLS
ncbi:MAG: transposase, partial [Thermus sp.]|nr:transposase [Thermus sp.]